MRQLVKGKVGEVDDLPAPTPDQILAAFEKEKRDYIDAIQRHLDATAQSWGYDSVDSAAKYAGRKKQKWSNEANALIDWTIDTWEHSLAVLTDVEAGTISAPTVDELIAGLPVVIREV